MRDYGAAALSTGELLACIIQPRNLFNAQELLRRFGLRGLRRASVPELCQIRGIGPAKAMQLMAALELGRRSTLEQEDDRPQITCPADAANLLINKMDALDQEHLVVISLDARNRVLAQETLYIGNVNTGIIRIAEIFRLPIRQNSNAIIISHNHPSGDPTPSPEDVHVTRQIVEAGKLLDIEVLDHLVIGRNRFVSLKERGLGFD